MLGRIYSGLRRRIKEPMVNYLLKVLMTPAKNFKKGRRLYGVEEFKNLYHALLKQDLFGIGGEVVENFEKEFASSYGVPYAVASTSGTAALHTAVGALDLNPGDEIITAPITDLGTIIPILYQNAIPVFADIDETYNMDPQEVEKKITSRTKAILAVHLFGNPCNMQALSDIAKKHNIPLIEDCSQAHMTEYNGKFVGTIGDIGCFSFQQSKHMSTGDGGMTITSNKDYYEKMKLFVDKGFARKGWGSRAYLFLAPNYRMNALTAAVGLAQLKKVKNVITKRNELGEYLTSLLSGVKGVTTAPVTQGAQSSYWMYPVLLDGMDIDALTKELFSQRVYASAGYTGKPIYLCTESLTSKKIFGDSDIPFMFNDNTHEYVEGLCPKAEKTLPNLLTLPLDESWTKELVETAANTIKTFAEQSGSQETAKEVIKENVKSTQRANDTKKLRVGIIGCGQMGRWHRTAFKQNEDVDIVAFCDTAIERAEDYAMNLPAKAYTNHKDMIQDAKCDAVSVCTVPSSHLEIVTDLLNNGIHVLCEKPLAISVSEANAMLKIAEEKKLNVLPAFKFRFFEEVQKTKELIDKGSLGKILSFRLMFGGYINMVGSWYAQKDISGGGIIMDNGPHAFDLIHYLLGDIEGIKTQVDNIQKIDVEDTAMLVCSLKNKARGIVDLSWNTTVPSQSYLEIYGEDGTALLDLEGLTYKFKTWDEWKRVPNKISVKDAFALQINHFIDAVKGKEATVVKNIDGLKAQCAIEQAYLSAEKNMVLEKVIN